MTASVHWVGAAHGGRLGNIDWGAMVPAAWYLTRNRDNLPHQETVTGYRIDRQIRCIYKCLGDICGIRDPLDGGMAGSGVNQPITHQG